MEILIKKKFTRSKYKISNNISKELEKEINVKIIY